MVRFLAPLAALTMTAALHAGCDWYGGKDHDSSTSEESRSYEGEPNDGSEASGEEESNPAAPHIQEQHGGAPGHHSDDGPGHHHRVDDEHE
jgi:hypothetical protein